MKIGVLGHFGKDDNVLNGQTIKTKNFILGIKKYTSHSVVRIDSCGWMKEPFHLLKSINKAFKICDCVVMFPAQNGVKVFAPLLAYYKRKSGKKIFYNVIGGWLPELLRNKNEVKKALYTFDGIWVETSAMKAKLESQGFDNIVVLPNFKEQQVLRDEELVYAAGAPYKLCTFSRVMKEKGIEDAMNAVKRVNTELGYTAYELDIYGQVATDQVEWFENLKSQFPSYIRYGGCVDEGKSVDVVKNYFALLFPTHFYTEGIPGTIIDAYLAGVPIITAKWENFADVVDDEVTGIGYDFDKPDMLEHILAQIVRSPNALNKLRQNCLRKASQYTSKTAIAVILQQIGDKEVVR